jgi:hypothetical protein
MVFRFVEHGVDGLNDGECFCYRLDLVVVVESAAVALLVAGSRNCGFLQLSFHLLASILPRRHFNVQRYLET